MLHLIAARKERRGCGKGGTDRKAKDDSESAAFICFTRRNTHARTHIHTSLLLGKYIEGRRTLLRSLLVSDAELKENTRRQQQRERERERVVRVCVFFFNRGTHLLVFYTQTLSLSLFYLTFKSRQIRRGGGRGFLAVFQVYCSSPAYFLLALNPNLRGGTVSFAPLTYERMRGAEASS